LTNLAPSGHQSNIIAILAGDLGTLVALLFAWNKKVLCGAVWHGGQFDFSCLWYQQVLQRFNHLGIIHVNHFEKSGFFVFSLSKTKSIKKMFGVCPLENEHIKPDKFMKY
jgi:hypothetical protein